jgi:hypothetical protein
MTTYFGFASLEPLAVPVVFLLPVDIILGARKPKGINRLFKNQSRSSMPDAGEP